MEIDLEFLCDEIYSLLEDNGITEEILPNVHRMIERFSSTLISKYKEALIASMLDTLPDEGDD